MSMDPFTAFGDDDSNDPHDRGTGTRMREPAKGPMAFHVGTEQKLLQYVQSRVKNDNEEVAAQVLAAIDDFCTNTHWMMHVGPDKGTYLDDFVAECVRSKYPSDMTRDSMTVVELGTYCGYSTTRIVQTVVRALQTRGLSPELLRVVTVDVEPRYAAVAKDIIALAGFTTYVDFARLHLDGATNVDDARRPLARLLREQHGVNKIDFLFVDHAKEAYLPDVQQLEKAGLIQTGTFVCADNVVVFNLHEYRDHMHDLQKRGVVQTRLVESSIEYPGDVDMKDGLELTVYLKDPS